MGERPRRGKGPYAMLLGLIIICGLLSVVYGVYTVNSVMSADAGTQRMQEISGAVREGAQAYLKRQYTTIGGVGVVVFIGSGFCSRGPWRSGSQSAQSCPAPPASSA